MEKSLSVSHVTTLVGNAKAAFPHEECATCECYLGYIIQLERESDRSGQQFLESYKPSRKEIHACRGCDPCPPGDHYARHLRDNRAE